MSENVIAFYHTRPSYDNHIVVTPLVHIDSLLALEDEQVARELTLLLQASAESVLKLHAGCRVLTNLGEYQDSAHLHYHVFADRRSSVA